MTVRIAVTVGADMFCSKGRGLSVAVFVAIIEVVPTAGLLDEVATRPVEGTVSSDSLWVVRLAS
jgi:hypothetical protein